jgi:hypothetical protein
MLAHAHTLAQHPLVVTSCLRRLGGQVDAPLEVAKCRAIKTYVAKVWRTRVWEA